MHALRCRYHRSGTVGTISLDAPRLGNAVDSTMTRDLLTSLEHARQDEPRMLVLTSTSKVFCGGLNLPFIRAEGSTALADALRGLVDIFSALHRLPFPTASFIDGAAIGSGADLAIATDLQVGTTRARFAFPGIGFGLLFGTHRLKAVAGPRVVHQAVLWGQRLDAHQALACGLVSEIVPDRDTFLDRCAQRVEHLPSQAVAGMLSVTRSTTLDDDRALLEQTLLQPDLFDQFLRFAEKSGIQATAQAAGLAAR